MNRRSFLRLGLQGIIVAGVAPAFIKHAMPVRAIRPPLDWKATPSGILLRHHFNLQSVLNQHWADALKYGLTADRWSIEPSGNAELEEVVVTRIDPFDIYLPPRG